MILELDIGNSRIKWRLRNPATGTGGGSGDSFLKGSVVKGSIVTGSVVKESIMKEGSVGSVSSLLKDFNQMSVPDLLRVASVRHDSTLQEIATWTEQHWAIKPRCAVVTRRCHGVTNSYPDVSKMGIDRWLAMLAAYHRVHAACLVVDAGTALTIDALDSSGQHVGGYILPGLNLMLESLENNTGIRLSQRQFRSGAGLANDTESAVLNGVLALATALIEKVSCQLDAGEQRVSVMLSGGDAPVLIAALAGLNVESLEVCPALVLDGLGLAHTEQCC